jgi:alkaline phosphatase D
VTLPLAALVALALLLMLDGAGHAGELLVTVGDTTSTQAHLWMRAADDGAVTVELVSTARPDAARRTTIQPGEDRLARVTFEDLEPGRRYRYQLVGGGRRVSGGFTTAPDASDPAAVRIVWSGDLGARGHCRRPGSGYAIFDAIARRRPDLFVFVGDTIYADHWCAAVDAVPGGRFIASSLDEFRAKHRYNRADPAVQRLFRSTSVSAVWDDHDVRSNFTGPHEPLMVTGRRAFVDYWPLATTAEAPTRLYRRLRWGRLVEVFILDTRQYRSARWKPDGPDKTMLGAEQRRWLIDGVSASSATWKVVVSSVPLAIPKAWPFGDSWAPTRILGYVTGFAAERDRILEALHDADVTNLVVLTADVHFAALMQHEPVPGFPLLEAVAGPLAASVKEPSAPAGGLRSRVLFARGGLATFGELAIDERGLTVQLRDGAGRLLHEQAFTPSPAGAR